MEKPAVVKTHLRNMIVVPEMIGSVVGVHSGKAFNQVEIKVCRMQCTANRGDFWILNYCQVATTSLSIWEPSPSSVGGGLWMGRENCCMKPLKRLLN